MFSNPISAPSPLLRIVSVDAIMPHEKSDAQRSGPLMERLQRAEYFTNPPLVAQTADGRYVLMDGSNRHLSMRLLGFEHILVQILDYESDYVELGVWQHVVADWDSGELLAALRGLDDTRVRPGWDARAIAQVLLREGPVYAVFAAADDLRQRNAALSKMVHAYHRAATLYRTPHSDPVQIWSLFASGIAILMFPAYKPQHIIQAAMDGAYLPPGISRHIVHGRALNVNYPMQRLRAKEPLERKNEQLQAWLREQYAARGIRYYAESTFQFAE